MLLASKSGNFGDAEPSRDTPSDDMGLFLSRFTVILRMPS